MKAGTASTGSAIEVTITSSGGNMGGPGEGASGEGGPGEMGGTPPAKP